ncbi:MAG: chitin-binding protein [Alphaproteobacteria bacterium]|nr:MAG: chitin-binding protein [Alphaproteobacteria bacterium]
MKTIVITGGARGIGRGLATAFLKSGHRVVITSRSRDSVDKATAELTGEISTGNITGNIYGFTLDLHDRASIEALWDNAVTAMGSVDIWINNAGCSNIIAPFIEVESAEIDRVMGRNVVGLLHACQVALKGMTAQGHGQLWNMEGYGSDGMKRAGMTIYGASKYAVSYITDSLVRETAGTPVQVCHLSPGIVVTDLLLKDAKKRSADQWAKAKKIYNILGDKVETVTPYLAKAILMTDKTGSRVAWLTRGKVARRFMGAAFNKRDLFSEYGL